MCLFRASFIDFQALQEPNNSPPSPSIVLQSFQRPPIYVAPQAIILFPKSSAVSRRTIFDFNDLLCC